MNDYMQGINDLDAVAGGEYFVSEKDKLIYQDLDLKRNNRREVGPRTSVSSLSSATDTASRQGTPIAYTKPKQMRES